MSGPSYEERITHKEVNQLASQSNVRRLRRLADRLEGYDYYDNYINNKEQIANLLRAKADKIEAALDTIECQTQHDDFQTLIKAIEWTETGDYSPESIQDAWDDYGEKE